MDQQEKAWLAQYLEGDVEALSRLVEHHRRPLFGFILKMTESQGDADEVFQETWLRAIKNLHKFDGKNLRSWLFRIAHNYIIDRVRKDKRMVDLHNTDEEDGDPIEERTPTKDIGPATATAGRDTGERIKAAVAELPDEQREVFVMRMEGDLPFKEIAQIQDTSINTALARMQYALSKLRDILQDDYQALARD